MAATRPKPNPRPLRVRNQYPTPLLVPLWPLTAAVDGEIICDIAAGGSITVLNGVPQIRLFNGFYDEFALSASIQSDGAQLSVVFPTPPTGTDFQMEMFEPASQVRNSIGSRLAPFVHKITITA